MPKQPGKKKTAPEPIDVAKELAENNPKETSKRQAEKARIPVTGDRVLRPGSDLEFEITWVAPYLNRVHIDVPRIDFEWRNVDPAN